MTLIDQVISTNDLKLQELAIKSELKVAMRYKNSKTVAITCKNRCNVKFKKLSYKAGVHVTKHGVTSSQSFRVGICFCWGTILLVHFVCLTSNARLILREKLNGATT